MIDPPHQGIDDQQGKDQQPIGPELLLIQQLWNDKIGIQIVEGDDKYIVDDKERSQEPADIELLALRPGIKCKGQHQETHPGCDMDNDLYGYFLQMLLLTLPNLGGNRGNGRNNR